MELRTAMLCVALGIGAIAAPMMASARVYLDIDVAPPAPRVEVIPTLRSGYVWAPGYWNWTGHRHVWVAGHRVRGRNGHHWVADGWAQRDGRWHREAGHWD